MKLNNTHIITLGFIFVIHLELGSTSPNRGRRRVCQRGEKLCGNLCYDYNIYSCQESERRQFLCHQNEQSCGEKCYDPSEQSCIGSGEDAFMCPSGHQKCGKNCYDPNTEMCSTYGGTSSFGGNKNNWGDRDDNQPIMSKDRENKNKGQGRRDKLRPNSNFNSESNFNFMNINSNKQGNSYCQESQQSCGTKCYDPKRQTCFESPDGSLLCPKGQRRCGNYCYNSNREICTELTQDNDNDSSCPRGQVLCEGSGRCYNPSEEGCFVSQNGGFEDQPRKNKGNSNGNRNKNPSTGSSFPSFPNSFSTNTGNCNNGQLRCEKKCYDPLRQVCLGQRANEKVLCESGQEACGKKCYDPFNQRCLKSNGQVMVCRWNERACGNRCSDPFKESCRGDGFN